MQPSFTFKNINTSEEVVAYATKKLKKLEKYRDLKIVEAKFVFETAKENTRHFAELVLQIKDGTVSAASEAKNMYMAIDDAVDKTKKQLERKKTSLIHDRRKEPKHLMPEEE